MSIDDGETNRCRPSYPAPSVWAGQVYESMNQNDKAVELYNKIKTVYYRSPISQDIDKYIERATK